MPAFKSRAKNPNPEFNPSDEQLSKMVFLKNLYLKNKDKNIIDSDVVVFLRHGTERSKAFYPDRVRAMRALLDVFSQHINLVTHQVKISIRNASDACGLSTYSDAELEKEKLDPSYTPQPNITRASRAFKDLVDLGICVADKSWQVWAKGEHQWIDKYFEVTPLFFKAFGVNPETVDKHRTNRINYLIKSGSSKGLDANLSPEQLGEMSITEIKLHDRMAYVRKVFERLREKRHASKTKRDILKLENKNLRKVAQENVVKKLGDRILQFTSPEPFIALVNQELALLRRLVEKDRIDKQERSKIPSVTT